MKKIVVTGGAGYIGSHTCVELLNNGYDVIIIDNFSNSKPAVIPRIEKLGGKKVKFYEVDLLDISELEKIFAENDIDSVIHFAALKAVGESVEKPLLYYENNVGGTLNLCKVMKKFNVKNLVFSSSATVYGDVERVPITEDFPLQATNPYGRTKLFMEEIFKDLYNSDNSFNFTMLRYFNPIGAHKSGEIGEDPNGIPNNLLPYISQVAIGKLDELKVFGDDYPTVDGTGVRDYIHVVDLAKGHLRALEHLKGFSVYNLGTGKGTSVLEMINAFEKASGRKVPYKIVGRRAGDVAICYADPGKAEKELKWKAEYNIDDMCKDAWNWQSKYPNGYED